MRARQISICLWSTAIAEHCESHPLPKWNGRRWLALDEEATLVLLRGPLHAVFHQAASNPLIPHVAPDLQNARREQGSQLECHRHAASPIYVDEQPLLALHLFDDIPIAKEVALNRLGFFFKEPIMDSNEVPLG